MASLFATSLWTAIIVGPLIYAVWIFIRNLRKFRQFVKHYDKFPGVPRHWLFGHMHLIPGPGEDGLAFGNELIGKIKEGVMQFWPSPITPMINVYHFSSVKSILKTSEPKPVKLGAYFYLLPWLGDGLLISRGQKWARNRRLLTPAFHFDILRPYMTVNNRCTDVLLNKLEKYAESGEYFEVFQRISLLTLDIILRCAFSYDNDCQLKADDHPYVKAVNIIQEAVVHRVFHPVLYAPFVFRLTSAGRQFYRNCEFVHRVSDEIIQKRKLALESDKDDVGKKHRYLDFLDILLTARDENVQGLSDQEIRDEVDTFLFEGHDTTASGISWTLYSLAEHPEHQRLCQQEIDEVLGDQPDRDIEWDDLPKLKYLTMCLKEALRLHTPVPYIFRRTTQDMMIEGHFLPARSQISVMLYQLHHNKEIWQDPEAYRPERFSEENINTQDSFAFVPFSAGPRFL